MIKRRNSRPLVILLVTASFCYLLTDMTDLKGRRENRVKRIPDVVIVGVKKSGTMTLGFIIFVFIMIINFHLQTPS